MFSQSAKNKPCPQSEATSKNMNVRNFLMPVVYHKARQKGIKKNRYKNIYGATKKVCSNYYFLSRPIVTKDGVGGGKKILKSIILRFLGKS